MGLTMLSSGEYRFGRVTIGLMCVLALTGPVRSQDVGSFLAGLLGASDPPAQPNNNNSTQNQLPCPGECVHAFTSILCSRVIEQFDCGASYLRCCVSSDFNFGTVVETSAPLPEDSSTDSSTTQYEVFLVSTNPTQEVTTNHESQSSSSPMPTIQHIHSTVRTTQVPRTTQKFEPCTGICVENIFVRYCGTTIPGFCEEGSTCCASNQDDDGGSVETTTISIPISWTTNKGPTNDKPQTSHYQSYDTSPSSTTLPAPVCPGSCVAPLFSLLCDSVNTNFYCPNDGRCCISSDEQEPEPTTTASSINHLSYTCPGACIPMFLRGMCNRPSEIMLRSDCDQDFVCCYQPDVKDHLNIESPQIPLIRPGPPPPPQSTFSNNPLNPQGNLPPPRRQHPMHHGYPQRPQNPYNGKPVPPLIISNSHAPPNGNQVYLGSPQSGYIPVQQVQPHGNSGNVKPYPQNNNYGSGGYEQPNIPIRLPYNASGEVHSTRLTVEAPQPSPNRDQALLHTYDKRRHNVTHATAPQNLDQSFIPHEIHHESSRLVPPVVIQNSKPVTQPNENPSPPKPLDNNPDRVISASISFTSDNRKPVSDQNQMVSLGVDQNPTLDNRFASDNRRPGVDQNQMVPSAVDQNPTLDNRFTSDNRRPVVDQNQMVPLGVNPNPMRPPSAEVIREPPHIERFRPIPSQENPPIIPIPNTKPSTSVLVSDTKQPPGHKEETPKISIPQSLEIPQTSFIPIQESFRPLQNQQRPAQPMKPKPIAPLRPPAPPVAALLPDKEEATVVLPAAKNESSAVESSKKPMPDCPGSCIGSFLRFTCFGNSAIYNGFRCEPEGTLCCTPVEHIEKYEEHLKSGSPLVLAKPDDHPKSEPSPDSTRRPGMYVCGIKGNQRRKTGRVLGGKTSAPGEWCWQVALINSKNQYLCGGALIGSRWVLTAAHCITALVRNGDAIYARVGDYDLSSQYGTPGAQTQKVSTSYIHHNHNGQTLDNDIALLRLENPVQLQESVCLACLPARGAESQPGKRCTVTGYGYMSESGPIALKIREAVLPIVEEKLCTEQINKVTEKRFLLPAGSFCAGGETGNDACQGDGGGPLTCESEGYHELTGLVSWGFGCGKENVPGVYVKVSMYIGWINQIISVNN